MDGKKMGGLGKYLRNSTRPLRRRIGLKQRREAIVQAFTFLRAKFNRRRATGLFIGVTGSSGKSTTVTLLSYLLKQAGSTEAQVYFNTFPELCRFLACLKPEVNFVPVEVGIGKVGSMMPMARLLRPKVVIVTQVGIEHYASFRGREGVAAEKSHLVAILPSDGLAILNADDPYVMAMANRTEARIVTFGWSSDADYRVVDARSGLPHKLSLTITCARGTFDIDTPFIADSFWLATAAAFAAAVELGVEPTVAADAIGTSVAPWSRSGLLEIDGGPKFIVDCRKAPADSIPNSVAPLHKAKNVHRRVILGQLADYKGSSQRAYRTAYKAVRAAADEVILVGDNIHKVRPSEEDKQEGKFRSFYTIREVSDHIHDTAQPNDLILLKSSGTMHMERIALSWTHNVQCWEERCGKSLDCLQCGMVEVPYQQHGTMRRASRAAKIRRWMPRLRWPLG